MITFYLVIHSKPEVSKVYEIDFEEELLFVTTIQLPEAIVATGALRQGILVISQNMEWNLLTIKAQDYNKFPQPALSSLFCGQLKEDFPLAKQASMYSF